MWIKIISVGKIKDKNLKELILEYKTRITHYCNLEIIELKEINDKSLNENIDLESYMINSKLNLFPSYEKILLDRNGEKISTMSFTATIKNNKDYKSAKIIFIIGGSNGVNKKKLLVNKAFSFGDITLPHQIFRLILLEQIYRAFKIIKNEKYHK